MPERPRVRGFAFDLDGTLALTKRMIHKGYTKTQDWVEAQFGPQPNRLTPQEVDARIGLRAVDAFDFLPPEATIDEALVVYRTACAEHIHLIEPAPSARETITTLGRNACVLFTSASPAFAELNLGAIGLSKSDFAGIITGDDVARGKPHPEGFLKAAAILALSPQEVGIVEDAAHGLKSGKAAGAGALLGVNYGFGTEESLREAGAHAVYGELSGVLGHYLPESS